MNMDIIMMDYDRKSREICYELSFKTVSYSNLIENRFLNYEILKEELEKSYIKIADLKNENFSLQSTIEYLKNMNADLDVKLKHNFKRLAKANVAPTRAKVTTDGSAQNDPLVLENKALKEMLHMLQNEKDELELTNSKLNVKYKCTLLNNEDLIKERNSLKENVELLTKTVIIKNKENSDLQLLKQNVLNLDNKLKQSAFYIGEIKLLKEMNDKQQEQISYYRAYADQLKDILIDLKRTKDAEPVLEKMETLTAVKPHYKYCIDEIESIKTNLALKLQSERKANELLIKIENSTRCKYMSAKNELEEINNKYNIVRSDLEKFQNKTFAEIEVQTDGIKEEQISIIDE